MYFTRGLQDPLSTLIVLASSIGPVNSASSLRLHLYQFLRKHRPRDDTFYESPTVVTDVNRALVLANRFNLHGSTDRPLTLSTQAAYDEAVLLLPEPYKQLLNIVVQEIVLMEPGFAAGSGALLDQPGTMYVAMAAGWTAHDVAECLVHESTHILLWLDELRYGHHPDPWATGQIEEFGLTSITGSLMSATVVFHSYVTAAEIVSLRRHQGQDWVDGGHGPATVIAQRTTDAYANLMFRSDLDDHFTPRALDLIESAHTSLETAAAAP